MLYSRIVSLLSFSSGIRSGSLAGDLERAGEGIDASTVWGGIGCCAARLFSSREVDRLLLETGVSSLLWEKQGVYYVPRPSLPFPDVGPERRKEAKKWKWLPVVALQGYVNGILPEGEPPDLYFEERQRSAAVDRATGSAVPYYRKRIVPHPGVRGVLVADISEELRHVFESAMRLLGDTGLGGERSHGWGRFEVGFIDGGKTPFGAVPPEKAKGAMALGAFLPDKEESALIGRSAREGKKPLGYEIQRMRGFTGEASDISKPTVACLAAGSVFPFLPRGKSEDITPAFSEHPVFFNGRPPFLPVA